MKRVIYTAGGIAGLNPTEVENRFNAQKATLEALGFEVLSPIRGKVIDAECHQRYEPNEIVHRDLNDVTRADLIIATPSDKSIGTFMEIFYASHVRHIPTIVVATNEHIAKHYWIRYFSSKIVGSFDEAIDYISKWYL